MTHGTMNEYQATVEDQLRELVYPLSNRYGRVVVVNALKNVTEELEQDD